MGRGSSKAGGGKTATFTYKSSELQSAFRKIASAPVGSVVEAKYYNGGNSTYEVIGKAGGKKELQSVETSRRRALSSASSAKNILGRPYEVKVKIKVDSAKQAFKKASESRKRNGAREITSGTYRRSQNRLNREVSNWVGNR